MTKDDGSSFRETITYYNSFGLNDEIREIGASPQGNDLQTFVGMTARSAKCPNRFPGLWGIPISIMIPIRKVIRSMNIRS